MRPDEIFEAATDEAAFAGLAKRLANSVGARSGVVHWREIGVPRETEISYSGYFSQSDMALYEELPSGTDLWTAAVNAASARNRVWDLQSHVAPSAFDKSIIYNEWLRRIGDDTFYCAGGVIEGDGIVVDIGFHRGKSQGAFSGDQLGLLQDLSRSIVQTMKVRQSIAAARRSSNMLNSALDTLGLAIFKLSAGGDILHRNTAADQLLNRGDGLIEEAGRLTARQSPERVRLAAAINAAAGRRLGTSALAIRRPTGDEYLLSLVTAWSESEQTILVTVEDPDHADLSVELRLQEIYALTSAEASIAVLLSQGLAPEAIARGRRTGIETVRGQIKSVGAKLGCGRQSEIVSVVRRLPMFSNIPAR